MNLNTSGGMSRLDNYNTIGNVSQENIEDTKNGETTKLKVSGKILKLKSKSQPRGP